MSRHAPAFLPSGDCVVRWAGHDSDAEGDGAQSTRVRPPVTGSGRPVKVSCLLSGRDEETAAPLSALLADIWRHSAGFVRSLGACVVRTVERWKQWR